MKADNHNKIAEAFKKDNQASALRYAIEELEQTIEKIEKTHLSKKDFDALNAQLWYKLKLWGSIGSAAFVGIGYVLGKPEMLDNKPEMLDNKPEMLDKLLTLFSQK